MAKKLIELVAVEMSSTLVDHAGNGRPDPGDVQISTDDLSRGGQNVGHDSVICTIVSVSDASVEVNCQATLSLPEGQITGQGMVKDPGRPGKSEYDIAITGGTGSYKAARGYIHVKVVSDASTDLTVHLN
ncbi:allene oxide cyclase barrel-like domain-containing protein [Nocardia sp. NPDC004085]